MKTIVLTMTDEDFEIVWRMINKIVEDSEDKVQALIREIDPVSSRNPELEFKGLYDLPNSSVDQIIQNAKNLHQSDIEVAYTIWLWRTIQGVLKNR